MMKLILLIIFYWFMCPLVNAEEQAINEKLSYIYQKAEEAIEDEDLKQADFWLARFMGLTTYSERTNHTHDDLFPLFRKREDLRRPTAFISGKFSDDFIDFFVRGTLEFWAIPDEGIREKEYAFAARSNTNEKYFVQLVISPQLESWFILKNEPLLAVIPLVSFKKPAFVVAGRLENEEPVKFYPNLKINTGEKLLHYIWPIEFHDLDDDKVPEIWIRYNIAWADGFSQRLDIYRIQDDKELVLFKRFEGHFEGIARRLSNGTIEVSEGFTDKEVTGHIGYDQHHVETFTFVDGKFIKLAERNIPHILWTDEWKKYYFEN